MNNTWQRHKHADQFLHQHFIITRSSKYITQQTKSLCVFFLFPLISPLINTSQILVDSPLQAHVSPVSTSERSHKKHSDEMIQQGANKEKESLLFRKEDLAAGVPAYMFTGEHGARRRRADRRSVAVAAAAAVAVVVPLAVLLLLLLLLVLLVLLLLVVLVVLVLAGLVAVVAGDLVLDLLDDALLVLPVLLVVLLVLLVGIRLLVLLLLLVVAPYVEGLLDLVHDARHGDAFLAASLLNRGMAMEMRCGGDLPGLGSPAPVFIESRGGP